MKADCRSSMLMAVLFALLAIPCALAGGSKFIDGEVIRVSDGDTVTIETNRGKYVRIRFYGIDCPETASDRWPAQPYSAEAKQFVLDMIHGKQVSVRLKGEQTYSREVGEVFFNGYSVNRELLRNGLAWWGQRYAPYDLDLERLADKARSKGVGLWADEDSIPPWRWRRSRGDISFDDQRTISPQEERDEIFMLLAYSVVLKHWQTGGPNQRGHNIGSILVDPDNDIVFWARNCNHVTKNGTQHGEVRLVLGFLDHHGSYTLPGGYTVYTTLEPCAQCSGMMTLQEVTRTVYGQTDPGFGKAIERLELDTHELPDLLPDKFDTGYYPYPRAVISDRSKSVICDMLDEAYEDVGGSITKFLLTERARAIYDEAWEMLETYTVQHDENQPILEAALLFLDEEVTDHYTPLKPDI